MDKRFFLLLFCIDYVVCPKIDTTRAFCYQIDALYDFSIFLWCIYSYSWSLVLMMASSNGNIFRVTGHLCGEFTGHRWIPRTKTSDAEL